MKGKWPLVLLGVLVVLSLVTIAGCGIFGPFHFDRFGHLIGNLQCSNPHVTVLPGQSNCKIDPAGKLECKLKNPCPLVPGKTIDGSWLESELALDYFVTGDCNNEPLLPGAVNGITVTGGFNVQTGLTDRFLVADLKAQPKVDLPVCYIYFRDEMNFLPAAEGNGTLFVTTTAQSPSGFKVGVQIPFDTPDGQVSVTVGNNVCLATNKTTCTQLVPGGTQVLLTVVKFPAKTTKVFWHDIKDQAIACDTTTATTCTFTVTKDTSVVPVFL